MENFASVVRKLFQATTAPDVLNFATGSPANASIPLEEIRELSRDILEQDASGYRALQYNDPQGLIDLREAVAEKLLPRRGISGAKPSQV